MKKAILFGLILAGFAFTSCKKDYTCDCTTTTVTSGLDGSFTSQSQSSSTIRATEENAIEECNAKSTGSSSNSGFDFTIVTKTCGLQ